MTRVGRNPSACPSFHHLRLINVGKYLQCKRGIDSRDKRAHWCTLYRVINAMYTWRSINKMPRRRAERERRIVSVIFNTRAQRRLPLSFRFVILLINTARALCLCLLTPPKCQKTPSWAKTSRFQGSRKVFCCFCALKGSLSLPRYAAAPASSRVHLHFLIMSTARRFHHEKFILN